jgi:glucoamylase
MPLVWAHAEYIKLLRSLHDGAIFDMPAQPVERYQKRGMNSLYAFWRPDHKLDFLPAGKTLRIESPKRATIYWTLDGWRTVQFLPMKDSELGLYYCDLPTSVESAGSAVGFTFFWDDRTWENRAYELAIVDQMCRRDAA